MTRHKKGDAVIQLDDTIVSFQPVPFSVNLPPGRSHDTETLVDEAGWRNVLAMLDDYLPGLQRRGRLLHVIGRHGGALDGGKKRQHRRLVRLPQHGPSSGVSIEQARHVLLRCNGSGARAMARIATRCSYCCTLVGRQKCKRGGVPRRNVLASESADSRVH